MHMLSFSNASGIMVPHCISLPCTARDFDLGAEPECKALIGLHARRPRTRRGPKPRDPPAPIPRKASEGRSQRPGRCIAKSQVELAEALEAVRSTKSQEECSAKRRIQKHRCNLTISESEGGAAAVIIVVVGALSFTARWKVVVVMVVVAVQLVVSVARRRRSASCAGGRGWQWEW